MYAIKNDKEEYLRVWNVNFETGFLAGYFTPSLPIQTVTSKPDAEKMLALVRSNGHKVELVEVETAMKEEQSK